MVDHRTTDDRDAIGTLFMVTVLMHPATNLAGIDSEPLNNQSGDALLLKRYGIAKAESS